MLHAYTTIYDVKMIVAQRLNLPMKNIEFVLQFNRDAIRHSDYPHHALIDAYTFKEHMVKEDAKIHVEHLTQDANAPH